MPTLTRKKGKLQRLIDHLPAVVFEYTFFPDGSRDFTYISPRCEELLGLKPTEILSGHLSIDSFIHPEDLGSFHGSLSESVAQLSVWEWKGRLKGREGFRWIETKSTPVRMKDGRIVYHGLLSDITRQQEMEERQHTMEQRYRDLVEQLPLGVAIHVDGKIAFANTAAVEMVGAKSADEVIGQSSMRFIHPDYIDQVVGRIKRIAEGGRAEPVEQKFLRLDGSVFDVESRAYPYLFEGKPAVQGIFTDITGRKKSEASLQQTETLFFQLFQNTPLAIVLLNERGEVVQINRGFEELFNYTREDLKGRALTGSIITKEFELEGNEINALITDNKVVRVETQRQRKDGKNVSVIIYGVPVSLHDKKIGIFGMYVDITERKKMEEELKVRNAELDNFVYKVSHDLRAPLSSVLGLAHLAVIPGNTDNLADYVRLMGEKAAQLDHFISDVLSHSKNLKMDVKIENVDLRRIIDQTFQDLSYLTGIEGVDKEIRIENGPYRTDPWRIAEILRNLVSNAIKYRKQTGKVEVKIDVRSTENLITIIFEDNGIGIDTTHLSRIFEMFYRASDQSEGSGLGLYIVKNAVDKLGGRIMVHSELDKGTRFEIHLPNPGVSE